MKKKIIILTLVTMLMCTTIASSKGIIGPSSRNPGEKDKGEGGDSCTISVYPGTVSEGENFGIQVGPQEYLESIKVDYNDEEYDFDDFGSDGQMVLSAPWDIGNQESADFDIVVYETSGNLYSTTGKITVLDKRLNIQCDDEFLEGDPISVEVKDEKGDEIDATIWLDNQRQTENPFEAPYVDIDTEFEVKATKWGHKTDSKNILVKQVSDSLSITINGKVELETDDGYLAGEDITVSASNSHIGTLTDKTDSNGDYEIFIENPPEGIDSLHFSIQVSEEGYKSSSASVDILHGETHTEDFQLEDYPVTILWSSPDDGDHEYDEGQEVNFCAQADGGSGEYEFLFDTGEGVFHKIDNEDNGYEEYTHIYSEEGTYTTEIKVIDLEEDESSPDRIVIAYTGTFYISAENNHQNNPI